MSYRDEREALKQRVDELEHELESTQKRAEQAESAQAKADRLALELAGAQRKLERIQAELSKLQGPEKKPNTGAFLIVAVAFGIVMLATLAVFVLTVRGAPPSPKIALTMTPIDPPAVAPIPPVPEIEPPVQPMPVREKTVRWTGKVRSSSGFSLPAGTPCFAEAALKSGPNTSIAMNELLVQCGDKKLYRLTDPLEGMSFSSAKIFEEPGAEVGSYAYSIIYQDQGQRSGKRSQISIDSTWGTAEVWKDSDTVFRVAIQLDSLSQLDKEAPLVFGRENAEIDFRQRLEWKASVTAVSGQSTVQKGQGCAIKILPMWGDRGHNCRVSLRCGEQVLYGRGDSGYNACEFKDGTFARVRDEGATAADGDPMFSLDAVESVATVRETGEDGFEINLRIETPKRIAK